MLRLSKLGPGRESYYLQTVGIEPAGEWMGHGSGQAGLGSQVGAQELSALLSGRDPFSGEVLGSGRNRVTVTGFDMTFAAPKSVSVLYGLGDQSVSDAVAEGHKSAVSAALSYVEDRALGVRRGSGPERTVERLEGAFGAAFLHRTSRALDPHLHSHVVVANLGRGPDGRFSALDGRGIYAHAGATGALYHVQLREELRVRLGVEWGPLDRGRADIAGINRDVRRGFSQRAAAIEADLIATFSRGDSGPIKIGGHRAVELASLKTRQPKDLTVSADDLRPVWRQRAMELGLGPARLDAVLERDGNERKHGVEIRQDPEQVVIRLASAGRAVSRRNIVQAWCMELPRGARVGEVERVSDQLLGELARSAVPNTRSDGRVRDGRGVTERRLPLESLELGPIARRFADQALERRLALRREVEREHGLDPAGERSHRRGRAQSMGIGRGRDLGQTELGLGLGLGSR